MCAGSIVDFRKYRKYIKDHCLQPETKLVLDAITDFYHQFPTVSNIDWAALETFIFSKHLTKLGSKVVTVKAVINNCKSYTPTVAYDELIRYFVELDYAARIALECTKIKEGSADLEQVADLAVKGVKEIGRFVDVESMFVEPDISAVCERIATTGYEWRLRFLNESLGPLRDGDFVLLAARVECGKTTFLASEVSYFLPQMPIDRPIVWVNNEERSEQVFFRIVQAVLDKTTAEVKADPAQAMKDFEEACKGRKILVTDGKTNHEKPLTSLFQDIRPGMIIFDQLDKVHGFSKDDREDLRLGRLYKWARDLAREYGPVITASQVSADVDKKEWPSYIGLDSLRGSKVDKPGEADAIITIGKATDPLPGEEHQRSINIPKNKMTGLGPYHKEELRHGQAIVMIDPLRGRYL